MRGTGPPPFRLEPGLDLLELGKLLLALRRAWAPVLAAEATVLLVVGVTMFWSFGVTAHLVAIAGSVAVTSAVLLTATAVTPAVRGDEPS